jgi:hypothetical protein
MGGADDPVPEHDAADLQRAEQGGEFIGRHEKVCILKCQN